MNNRNLMIDCIRGLALFAILLLHSIEHFGLFGGSIYSPSSLVVYDKHISKTLYFLFSGKAYAVFSLLLGFSFWLQYEKHKQAGVDYGYRYIWRLFILFLIGLVHAAIYSGDILVLYALTGVIVVLTRKLNNKEIALIAVFLLCEPISIYRSISILMVNDIGLDKISPREFYLQVKPFRMGTNIVELFKANLIFAFKANMAWNWEHGRIFQTPGLFLLGVLAARMHFFSKRESKIRIRVFSGAFITLFFLLFIQGSIHTYVDSVLLQETLKTALQGYINISGMLILVTFITLLWQISLGKRFVSIFGSYGRMSLTNYITQGVFGVFIFQGVGLGVYQYCGATLSTLVALVFFFLQSCFSCWLLSRYKQGPMEFLWRKMTNIRVGRT